MPLRTTPVLEQHKQFVRPASIGTIAMSELCRRFGIRRETDYRLLRRFAPEKYAEFSVPDFVSTRHCRAQSVN
jgi:hypothetical protein